MTISEIEAQEQRTLEAMKAFQAETTAYKKLAKQPPLFLKDGQAKMLRGDMLSNAKLYPNRFDMIKALISGGVGAEVGVQYGEFSRFILDNIAPTHLFLYDMVAHNIRKDVLDDERTKTVIGDSSKCLARSEDQSFDWIYIDGDHSYQGARKDTYVARRKIKEGGILIFNDYTPWSIGEVMPYGVMPVVNDLVNEGYPMIGLALAPHGYFDVAVRYKKA
jgi:Methyltransferase domain